MELSKNEKIFRAYLKKYHPDKYDQLIIIETKEKNTISTRRTAKTKNIELSKNEKKFRSYLKRYHPDKYDKLIAMEI